MGSVIEVVRLVTGSAGLSLESQRRMFEAAMAAGAHTLCADLVAKPSELDPIVRCSALDTEQLRAALLSRSDLSLADCSVMFDRGVSKNEFSQMLRTPDLADAVIDEVVSRIRDGWDGLPLPVVVAAAVTSEKVSWPALYRLVELAADTASGASLSDMNGLLDSWGADHCVGLAIRELRAGWFHRFPSNGLAVPTLAGCSLATQLADVELFESVTPSAVVSGSLGLWVGSLAHVPVYPEVMVRLVALLDRWSASGVEFAVESVQNHLGVMPGSISSAAGGLLSFLKAEVVPALEELASVSSERDLLEVAERRMEAVAAGLNSLFDAGAARFDSVDVAAAQFGLFPDDAGQLPTVVLSAVACGVLLNSVAGRAAGSWLTPLVLARPWLLGQAVSGLLVTCAVAGPVVAGLEHSEFVGPIAVFLERGDAAGFAEAQFAGVPLTGLLTPLDTRWIGLTSPVVFDACMRLVDGEKLAGLLRVAASHYGPVIHELLADWVVSHIGDDVLRWESLMSLGDSWELPVAELIGTIDRVMV